LILPAKAEIYPIPSFCWHFGRWEISLETETTCLTCSKWASNYMTQFEMGHCAHMPKWISTPHNAHCDKHQPAENIARRLAWLEAKRVAK